MTMPAPGRIARIGIRAFDLPLARPLRLGGDTLERRAGLLVIAEDGAGHAGIGEAAPLPGLHRESLGEAEGQLLALAPALEGTTVPAGCAALDGAFAGWLADLRLHPSVRTAIEGAVLGLLADRRGVSVPRLLSRTPAARVRVNGLLDGEPAAVLDEGRRLAAAGYEALKVKVGRRDPGAEAQLVSELRAAVGPAVAVRLDANRSWDLGTAAEFAAAVAPAGIAYIEEPLRRPGDLPAFAKRSAIPLALDETLLECSPRSPPPLGGVAALILKPAVLGGYEVAMSWARLARRVRLDAVVSAAYPSAVGLGLDAAFAAALGEGTVHGLGTSGFLAADLGRTAVAAPGGEIDATNLPFRPDDFDLGRSRVLR